VADVAGAEAPLQAQVLVLAADKVAVLAVLVLAELAAGQVAAVHAAAVAGRVAAHHAVAAAAEGQALQEVDQ